MPQLPWCSVLCQFLTTYKLPLTNFPKALELLPMKPRCLYEPGTVGWFVNPISFLSKLGLFSAMISGTADRICQEKIQLFQHLGQMTKLSLKKGLLGTDHHSIKNIYRVRRRKHVHFNTENMEDTVCLVPTVSGLSPLPNSVVWLWPIYVVCFLLQSLHITQYGAEQDSALTTAWKSPSHIDSQRDALFYSQIRDDSVF